MKNDRKMGRTLFLILYIFTLFFSVSCGKNENQNVKSAGGGTNSPTLASTPSTAPISTSQPQKQPSQGKDAALLIGCLGSTADNEPKEGFIHSYLIYKDKGAIKQIEKAGKIIVPGKEGFFVYKSVKKQKDAEIDGEKRPYYAGSGGSKLSTWIAYPAGHANADEKEFENKLIAGSFWSNRILFVGHQYAFVQYAYEWERGPGGRGGGYHQEYLAKPGKIFNGPFGEGGNMRLQESGKDILKLKDIFDPKDWKTIEEKIRKREESIKANPKYAHGDGYSSPDTALAGVMIERNEGVWKLNFPVVEYTRSGEWVIENDFSDMPLPKELVSYNKLTPSWAELKKKFPDMTDAMSAPNQAMLVILTKNQLKAFHMPLNDNPQPALTVSVPEGTSIISNEWALDAYVGKWVEEVSKIKE